MANQLSTSEMIQKISILLSSNEVTCIIVFNLFYSYKEKTYCHYIIYGNLINNIRNFRTTGRNKSMESGGFGRIHCGTFWFCNICVCAQDITTIYSRLAKIKQKLEGQRLQVSLGHQDIGKSKSGSQCCKAPTALKAP